MNVSGKRVLLFVSAAVLGGAALLTAFPAQKTYAAGITERSLTLKTGPAPNFDGGSLPGGTVNHEFEFTLPTSTGIGSLRFLYCTTATGNDGNPLNGCTPPPGMNAAGATLGAASGGQTYDSIGTGGLASTANSVYVTKTLASNPTTDPIIVQLDSVVNPIIDSNPANGSITFFVRIFAYASTNGTGTATHTGTVTASTANKIQLTGIMPESLVFCAGGTIDVNASDIPQCSTATSGSVQFNQLFSPESTSWATSQMAASTNATTGYVITASGPTLTSGSNTIPAIGATASASNHGTGQFGMNLKSNTADSTIGSASNNPITYYTDPEGNTGGDVFPIANGSNYRGQAKANFDTAGTYAFNPAASNIVAASDYTVGGPTDSQRFTATYIVNVSGSQPAGTYVSTITYICTPTF